MLIELALQNGTEYRVAFKNFFVISRYNPSTNYTMAVCDLAQELRQAMSNQPDGKPQPQNSAN
jgi:membrane-bound lytic murein transglycosylase B